MTRRLFSLSLMILLAIGAWADEVIVNTEKTWTFNSYNTGTITSNQENDGLYTRAYNGSSADRTFTISEISSIEKTIGGQSITINKIATGGSNINVPNTLALKTANEAGNGMKPFFAFNTSLAGTCYVLIQKVNTQSSNSYRNRIYWGDGTNAIASKYSQDASNTTDINEISWTSTAAGTFVVGSSAGNSAVYAIRFVPETVSTPSISQDGNSVTITSGTSSITGTTLTTYYTTDGTTPSASNGTEYTGPISLTQPCTINAITVSSGGSTSDVASQACTYYINSVDISGLSAPITDQALKITSDLGISTEGVAITGITWSPETTPATANTIYTATLTLTANTGYQFASTVTANSISEKAGVVTRTDETHVSITYTFDATATNVQDAVITAEANQSTIYNGTAQAVSASVSGGSYAITYYTNAEHSEGETTEAPINAGTYYAIVSQSDANYTSEPVNVTFTINKATLTATADNQSKTAGEENPELTVTVTGFVNEETANTAAGYTAPIASTEATNESPAGEYAITVSGGSATNYNFNYVNGTLTVNAPTTYDVSKAEGNSENVSVDKSNPTAGETVTITVTIPDGKRIVGGKPVVCKTDDTNVTVEVTRDAIENNKFTFTMPAYAVTVSVEFEDIPSIYGTYDFQTWAEANISTKAQSLIVLDENGYMTGTFTPSDTETINGTMTLNDAFSITGTSYRLRKNGSTGNANSGLMIAKTGGAKLTINRLKAGDWFTITTDVADRLQFATSNTDVHPAGSTETITQNGYVQSGTVYIATAATIVDVYSKDVGTVYIHSIQISNEDAVSAPTITVDGGNQVTIDGGTSLKGSPVTVYYTTDNTDPKSSETRQTYSSPFTPTETVKVRAYSVLTSDDSVISAEASPAVVRIGTWTGEQNVFDFASAATNYVDITFGETAVEGIRYYGGSSSQDNAGDFYPIINTDWMTSASGNTAVISWRNGSGNAAFENGGLVYKNQRYFAVSGLTTGQRVKILFDGQLRYRTNVADNAPVVQKDGSDVAVETTYGSSTATDTEITLTITSGSYLVFYCNTSNDVIKKISVLQPIPSYLLTVNYDNTKGSVTDDNDNALAESYQEGTIVKLKATATADGYQFSGWTDGEDNFLSLKNPYEVTINSATTIKALFTQPTSPAVAITAEKHWTFDAFTGGTEISKTQVYDYNGLYISGHHINGSNPAKITAGASTTDTQIDGIGSVTNYLQFAGGNTSSLSQKEVTDYVTDKAAFKVGVPGTVSIFTGAASDRKFIIEYDGASAHQYSDLALGLQTKDITEASNVYIGTTAGAGFLYAVKFTPETITAPVISVNETLGTITAGTSNLTEEANKVIKTYYTIDGTDPTTESTLYDGVIMASGSDITVKAISINTITGTMSDITTETGLTLALPAKTVDISATTGGSITWKVSGAADNTDQTSFSQGTSIEVTATPASGYMFQNWTVGEEVVAKTPVYTFTLNDDITLVANFKDMSNTVPVILTAGQSNTDGRVPANELPTTFTGLENCYWSYCNAKQVYAGSAIKTPYTTVGNLEKYSAKNDNGGGWAYDAVVYNKIGEQLGQKFYVIKQSKGNTGISPASGGNGLFWSANPLWLSRNESANNGGRSLLKALIENIDASLTAIETESGKTADVKFLMWHQGEGDGNGSQGPVYYTQLKALINYVRNHLAAKNAKYSHLPFILGGITSVSAQYNADVEAAKQQLASEDANIYYVDINEVGTDGLLDDVLHFNATGAQTLGNKVWQTIYENNLMAGLAEGTGSSEPVADILTEATPVTNTTKWDFSDKAEGTAYAEKTNVDGMYLHGSSSNKMTVKAAGTSSVSYSDGESVSTTMALRSASGDRSKFMTNGLTAGDVVAIDRMIGVNTNGAGTFYAVIAPETQPTTGQESRELYLLFNGEKVATINALEAWNASDDHTIKLKYAASEAGTFFLTGQHPYLLYAAKFVKAGEETGGFTLTTIAEGGTITMTAPEGKTLNSTFSKGEEVTLKATADEGYALLKWTDGADNTLGSSENLTITMNSDMTVKAVFTSSVDKPTISKTYTVNDDSYTYTLNYMEGATLHYTLPGGTEQTVSGGVSIDVNVTVIGDLTAYATCGNLTSETLTSRVYGPTQKIENGGVYDFSLVKTSMIKDYTLGTIGYGDEVTVGNMTLYKPDAVVSKTLDRFAFAPKLNESGKNAADWMLLSAGRLRAKSSDMTDYLAILDVKQGDYVKITYSGGAELRYVQESTAKLIEGTNVLTSGQAYEAQSDGVLLLTVPANESNHCDITNISITNLETVSAPTLSLKDNTTNVVRLRQGSSSFGKTVTTYYTTDRSVPSESNGTAVTKSPYDISLESTSTVKAITISETGKTSDVTSVTFVIQDKGTTEEVTEIVTINDDNTATVSGIAISEGATAVTISGSIDGAPVTSIADNTFTAANTANVAAVDLSETAVTMTGNREEIPALKNINEATLVYLPSTANVTGTNVVTKSGENFTCADYQLFDGHQGAVPHSFTATSAILNRVFTADKKCTVCLPYPFTATGGTYYKFTGISSSKVQMTAQEEGTTLDANTPYIFVPSSGTDNISASNVEVSISGAPQTENAEAQFTFIGTYEHIVWDAPDGIYGFAAEEQNGVEVGQFVRVGIGASIGAYRAYLKYTGNDKLNGTANAARRTNYNMPEKLQIEWIPAKGSADTTSIETTVDSSTDDMPVYNISGQRVNHNYKGMVIKNGKKMINK